MANKTQGLKAARPPIRRSGKKYFGADFDDRERLDLNSFERDTDFLRILCPETFGKHGPMNTKEELRQMLGSLPSSFPVFGEGEDKVVTAGEIRLDWFEIWKLSESLYELAEQVIDETNCTEVEALRTAHVIRIAALESITSKITIAMADAFDFLLTETFWDAMDISRVPLNPSSLPRNKMIKSLSRQFEASLRRRNEMPKGRKGLSSSLSWRTIVTAIKSHRSAIPPSLGRFAASMTRFKDLDEKHARDAMKKELAKLHREGFCPETNWPKLYTGIRSGTFPSPSCMR